MGYNTCLDQGCRVWICLLALLALSVQQTTEQEKKAKVQHEELEVRESIGLKYGENTQSLTFALKGMTDFVLKTSEEEEEIKMTIHTYWQQGKIYISSEYQEGENMRVLVYEDDHRILIDNKFYVTWGIKFLAKKNSSYTIRFVDEGSITKLIAAELTKTTPDSAFSNLASTDHIQQLSRRLDTLKQQMKMMAHISEFGIVMHEQTASKLNHSTCLYMTYLLGEAFVILLIVSAQVTWMFKMLKVDSIV